MVLQRIHLMLIGLGAGLVPAISEAHPGGLDASGCHHNRKTGDYHCHRGTTSAPAPQRQTDRFSGSNNAFYQNCTAARAAGVAPLRRGEPGYRAGLDRDNDGVACE